MKAKHVAEKLNQLNKALEYADAYGIDLGGYYQFGTKNLIEMITSIRSDYAMTKEQAELLIDAPYRTDTSSTTRNARRSNTSGDISAKNACSTVGIRPKA